MPAICLCKKNVNLLSNPTEMCAVCDFDFSGDLEPGVVQGQKKFGSYLFVCAAAIANETTRKKYAEVVSSFASIVFYSISKGQKRVIIVDLVNTFETSIYSQNSASIQTGRSLSKFAKKIAKVRSRRANSEAREGNSCMPL